MIEEHWTPMEWRHKDDVSDHETFAPKIVRMNSPFYDGARFAVRIQTGEVLNIDGEWEFEPMPSSRDDAFYERCRFKTFEEARRAAERARKT